MIIRPYQKSEDYSYYLSAEQASFMATYPEIKISSQHESQFEATLNAKFEMSETRGFTSLSGSNHAGMILTYITDFGTGPSCSIDNVYVSEQFRGKRVVDELFIHAEKDAISRGVTTMRLGVSVANEVALRTYERLGYTIKSHAIEKQL